MDEHSQDSESAPVEEPVSEPVEEQREQDEPTLPPVPTGPTRVPWWKRFTR